MNTVSTLFLVRHGQTEWNLAKRSQGQLNSPLTNLGRSQAKQVKDKLLLKNIHKAYSSPLLRAVDTTSLIIDSWPITMQVRQNLAEIHQGPWQGRTYEEIQQRYPEEHYNFWEKPDKYQLSGAENYLELQQRVVFEIKNIFKQNRGKNILVVSHGIVIKVIVAFILHKTLAEIAQVSLLDNGKYICLKQQNKSLTISS